MGRFPEERGVSQARDTKLDRDVALKVRREAVPSNLDRLARFQREAPCRQSDACGMHVGRTRIRTRSTS